MSRNTNLRDLNLQTVKLREFKQKGFRQSDFYAFYIIFHSIGTHLVPTRTFDCRRKHISSVFIAKLKYEHFPPPYLG